MRGMLPPSEARMRMCVMKVGERGPWTYGDWIQWSFLWKFFPWYARNLSIVEVSASDRAVSIGSGRTPKRRSEVIVRWRSRGRSTRCG